MSPTSKDYVPRASDWFSSTPAEYVGRCKAEFAAPRGSVQGSATAAVDETGKVTVRMVPEAGSLTTANPSPYGMVGFFGGEGYAREERHGVMRLDPEARNPCTVLEIETPRGTFRTDDILYYGTHGDMSTGEVTEANFAVGLSQFEATPEAEPAYWVLPLANFSFPCRSARTYRDEPPMEFARTFSESATHRGK